MKPSIIHKAIVAAFNKMPLSRNQLLSSTYSHTEAMPSLVWQVGKYKSEPWTDEKYQVTWTIPAKLTVKSTQANPERLLEVVGDVQDWCGAIVGIPIDADNNIVPRFSDQLKQFRAGKVNEIAERFAGPYIVDVSVPEATNGAGDVYVANITFAVEFLASYPKAEEFPIRQFILGIQPMDPEFKSIGYNPNKPFELQLPLAKDPDVVSRTPYADPETILRTTAGDRIYGSFPPLLTDYAAVAGPDPATTLVRLDVLPAAFTLSPGSPTLKASAIGYFMDGGTARLDAAAMWQTSAPLVATVGVDGLVTRVGAGTTIITASYNGLSNTALVTVS